MTARVDARASSPDEDGVYARVPAGGTATASAVVAVQGATAGANANAVKATSRNPDATVYRAQGPGPLYQGYNASGSLVFEVDETGITVGGAAGTPSGTVTTETSYGQASAAGASTNYSRGDHTHGTPAAPTPGGIGALAVASNLSDLNNTTTARTNLGLGGAATLNVGTSAGTVAAGDDSRITAAQQRSTVTTKGDLYAATASATTTRLPAGTNGHVLVADSAQSAGLKYAPRITIVEERIVSGDTTLPNTSGAWQALSGFDLSLAAAEGDYIDTTVHAMRSVVGTGFIDLAISVGGSIVRYLATGTSTPGLEGSPGFYAVNGFLPLAGPRGFVVQSGDLSGGTVTVIVAVKAAGAGTLFSSSNYPFYWRLANWGPVA